MKNRKFFEVGKWYKVKQIIAFSTNEFNFKDSVHFEYDSIFLLLTSPKKGRRIKALWDENLENYSVKILYENKPFTIFFGGKSYFTENLNSYLEKIS